MTPDRGPSRPYEQRDLVYVSITRLAALPLFLGFQLIVGNPIDGPVLAIAAFALPYMVLNLWAAASPGWRRIPPPLFVAGDLIVMAIGLMVTGGPGSEVQVIFFIWAISMSLLFPPRQALVCLAAAMVVLAIASIPAILDGPGISGEDLRLLAIAEVSLLWIGILSFLSADAFHRRQERIVSLSEARRSLLADALSAEDRARRRLSQSLHDDALQTLLAAGQDLDAGLNGDSSQLERARDELRSTIRGLRETIRGLHPAALEHGGLAGGLDAVVERAASQGGFLADLRVDPEATGWHDALIVSLVRELATNAAKHAEATRFVVAVNRASDRIEIEVTDDGRGMPAADRGAAIAAGHIGLASSIERVEAAGGRMTVTSAPDHGTRIAINLPLPKDLSADEGRRTTMSALAIPLS